MPDNNRPKDNDLLREALQDSDAATFGDLDELAIDEILRAVADFEWLAGWEHPDQKKQSPKEENLDSKARKLENVARDFQQALYESESSRRINYSSTTRNALKSLLPNLLLRLRQLQHNSSDQTGRPHNPEKYLVIWVSQAVRRYGHERQELEFEGEHDPSKTGRHAYPQGLKNDAHLVLVIREVLGAIGHPTDLSDDTLLRYARSGDTASHDLT